MRSPTSARRLRSRPPRHRSIESVAHLVDQETLHDAGHVAVYVADDDDAVVLGLLPLEEGVHPFAALAGFTAPSEWSMFGLRVRGTAHHLDGATPSQRSSTTLLMDRRGGAHSILRVGDTVTDLPGPAEGTIPDLCRRVLGLPTAPPPRSTAPLWAIAWLDRVLATWVDPSLRRRLTASWAEVAALHPAVAATLDPTATASDDPMWIVSVGRDHAEAWPWARLRAESDALPLPDGTLSPAVTAWMDDGFYARWALGAFPAPAVLARDLAGLLGDELGDLLVEALEGLLTGPAE